MGRLYGSEHTGSKTLVGLIMLATASTTAMGTTQSYQSIPAGNGLSVITSHLQESAVIARSQPTTRLPFCTPGFSCNAPVNQAERVSRYEALKFALLMGTGASR